MIIIKVMGGLGNQMFQYSFYKQLKSQIKDAKLDLSVFENCNLHNGYELNKIFNVDEDIASKDEIMKLSEDYSNNQIFRRIKRKFFGIKRTHYVQRDFGYNKLDFIGNMNDLYLEGYWQSEKYFSDVKDVIVKEFTFKNKLTNKNKEIVKLIKDSNSISVHIRRGDYIFNPEASKIYSGICNLEYYKNALDIIKNNVSKPQFLVFSDDMDWVKNNLSLESCVYVDWNKNQESYIDMQLMSLCKHNIIANSTFSWWGAWLNSNENKIVIAPKKWFNTNANTTDLIPESWKRI